ncbi:MAG TPA: hypothetical protein VIC26_05435 [Marinagarivorans sp.]
MNIIRSDAEVIMHDAFVALEETVDQYADSAEFLDESPVATYFKKLSHERLKLLSALAEVIRQQGSLPPAADEDTESFLLALQHLFASLAGNAISLVVEQCLHKENDIKARLKALLTLDGPSEQQSLFKEIYQSHRRARLYLRLLHRDRVA